MRWLVEISSKLEVVPGLQRGITSNDRRWKDRTLEAKIHKKEAEDLKTYAHF